MIENGSFSYAIWNTLFELDIRWGDHDIRASQAKSNQRSWVRLPPSLSSNLPRCKAFKIISMHVRKHVRNLNIKWYISLTDWAFKWGGHLTKIINKLWICSRRYYPERLFHMWVRFWHNKMILWDHRVKKINIQTIFLSIQKKTM